MKLYRFLTGPDDASFCHKVTSALNKGWHIYGSPTYAFDAGLPFGLNARQQAAWLYEGGGLPLIRDFYKKTNVIPFPCGNVGTQMGGFYRKEINTVQDLQGLKIRIGGLGGVILRKLGAVPQQLPPSDIYSALERGTIDASEWIGPYDDAKLGLNKVAKFYYAPGWWEGSAGITAPVSLPAWQALPELFKVAFETAATLPDRIGAVASFHGGGLVTKDPTSPHLLIPKTKASFVVAIAQNDDAKQPDAKDVLKATFAAAKRPAVVEVFPADHGWCVPGSQAYNEAAAERAWGELLKLYKANLG